MDASRRPRLTYEHVGMLSEHLAQSSPETMLQSRPREVVKPNTGHGLVESTASIPCHSRLAGSEKAAAVRRSRKGEGGKLRSSHAVSEQDLPRLVRVVTANIR